MKTIQEILTGIIMFCVLYASLTIGRCSYDLQKEIDRQTEGR